MTNSGGVFIDADYKELVVPCIWEQETFIQKAGKEITNQMWAFNDKKGRDVCLIPEVTGIIQDQYNDVWKHDLGKNPMKIFYVSRCYRYERPQAGRYREFTQFGLEILGGTEDYAVEAKQSLQDCLDLFDIDYRFDDVVKRGLTYYVEDGFEAVCESLGAQKQIAGGGRYAEGVGWAIGVDRLMIAQTKE